VAVVQQIEEVLWRQRMVDNLYETVRAQVVIFALAIALQPILYRAVYARLAVPVFSVTVSYHLLILFSGAVHAGLPAFIDFAIVAMAFIVHAVG
jgi:hypothetical protein